jgi:outer membrane biosynthesis protein TonB
MIPRSLVPPDVRLPEQDPGAATPRRLTTLLDDRTIVAANMPHNGLETRSNIPAHMPLDVLASRTVVPRDMPETKFEAAELHPDYDTVTTMDQRFTVPAAMPVVEFEHKGPVAAYDLPDVLQPDVLMTGEANLSVEPIEKPSTDWDLISRVGSIAAHILLIIFVIFEPKIFPYQAPTQASVDLGKDLGFVYMPSTAPGSTRTPRVASPAIRVNPGELRKAAPSMAQPMPAPKGSEQPAARQQQQAPVEAPPDLPVAPKPQEQSDRPPDFLTGRPAAAPQAQPQPQQQQPSNGLILPRSSSPGRSLEDAENQALGKGGGGGYAGFGTATPGGGGYRGGGGEGGLGGGLQMLTPTEGVDFSGYLAQVVARVKRNWYSIMPESALLGDKGRVILQFKIMRNGAVLDPDPLMMGSSGKEPLDRAASGAIHASSPFEPLPSAFQGPYIELRFFFLYNVPIDQQ